MFTQILDPTGNLFVTWLVTFLLFDPQIYMTFTPGQLRVRQEIGVGETTVRRVAEKVGGQNLHGGARALPDGQDAPVKMVGAAVGKVVARHGGDDHMSEA